MSWGKALVVGFIIVFGLILTVGVIPILLAAFVHPIAAIVWIMLLLTVVVADKIKNGI